MDQRVNDHSRPERRSRSESAAQIADAVSQMHQTVYEMDKAAENFFETELLDDSSDEESEEQPTRSRSESAAQIAQAVTQMHQTAYEMDKAAEDFYDMGAPAVDQIRSAPFGGDCDVVDLAEIAARMAQDEQLEEQVDYEWGTPTHSFRDSSHNLSREGDDDTYQDTLNPQQLTEFAEFVQDNSTQDSIEEQPTRSRSESAAQIAALVTQMHQTAYEMDKAAEDFHDAGAPAVDQIRSAPFGGDCDVLDLAEIAARMAQDEQLEDEHDYATPTAIY